MLTEQDKLDGTLAAIRSYVPGFSTSLKSKSKVHKFLGKFLNWLSNKQYMDCYWTTLGKIVYRPTPCDSGPVDNEWRIMLHEGRHADDCYRMGPIMYAFLYLFPQILGILGVLYALVIVPVVALGGPWALLWGLLALLCLAPLPALPRAIIEVRGYIVTMAVDFWCGDVENWEEYIDDLAESFADGSYYYMMPFKGMIRRYFTEVLVALRMNYLDLDSYLIMCKTKCSVYR